MVKTESSVIRKIDRGEAGDVKCPDDEFPDNLAGFKYMFNDSMCVTSFDFLVVSTLYL